MKHVTIIYVDGSSFSLIVDEVVIAGNWVNCIRKNGDNFTVPVTTIYSLFVDGREAAI